MSGIMSALLACSGGALLVIHVAESVGLNRSETVTWMFAVYFLGGLLNLVLTIWYKIPFGGAHSITAVAFLTSTAAQYSLSELAGGFIMSGLIITFLGFTGLFNKVLNVIPKPFIDALLAGIILNYVVKIVPAAKDMPFVGLLAFFGFCITFKISKRIPPFIGALVFAIVGLLISYDFPIMQFTKFVLPHTVLPSFSMGALVSIAIPISILILSNDIAVALAALKNNGYDPPVNKTLIFSGLFSATAGLFSGHAANIGGMMSALCSGEDAGTKDHRFWAAIVSGTLVMLFGIFAWKIIDPIELLPSSFVTLITGFSLVGVLLNSLQSTFSATNFRFSTMFTFIISVSNISILGISSPVWALVIGVVTAKLFGERTETL
ncbi:benzoate transporter [Paenibacillus sp. SYP-B3998]|uniref:Benzoate transporter n=2 Tax=Paenibacillus sp. SYP-B3998 TaxID=2678564 RepID=A0A6G3ZW99_9BACL|nr:benzoate transporter [Paenibacillus sp. SYP-B3998]